MDGGFVIDEGSLYDFLAVAQSNIIGIAPKLWMKAGLGLRYLTRRLRQMNSPVRARKNVPTTTTSTAGSIRSSSTTTCNIPAPISRTEAGLEEAQLAKKRHLAAKLALEPGQRVLDIGSGWGGLGLYLAEHADVDVTGVTLSDEQHAVSNRRAAEKGLSGRVRFLLKDYRQVARAVRPHRLGRHVRACRRRPLPAVLRSLPESPQQGRRHRPPFDRSLRRTRRHQSVDPEIHLPGRLHPGAVGGDAGGRADRLEGHRRGDPAPPLRRDADATGASASSPTARRSRRSTTSASAACGSSISRVRKPRSSTRT